MKGMYMGSLVCGMLVLSALLTGMTGMNAEASEGVGSGGSTHEQWGTTMEYEATLAYELGEGEAQEQAASPYPERIPYWLDMVDAEQDDVSNTGEGVYIAVLDTGMNWAYSSYFFSGANIAYGLGKGFSHDLTWNPGTGDYDWGPLRDDRGIYTNMYGSGHGMHVTSTITGFRLNAFDGPCWVRGVAPGATVIPVLVLDTWFIDCPDPNYYNEAWGAGCHAGKVCFKGGTDEMVAAGINYITGLAGQLDAPVVISMSLGDDEPSELIKEAIDDAIEAGVIIVAAAGNEGDDGMLWPGAYSEVISAAMGGWTQVYYPNALFWRDDFNDVPEKLNTKDYLGNNWQLYLHSMSSRPNNDLGQKSTDLDVVAPGHKVLGPYKNAVYWSGTAWRNYGPNWYWLSGTSMATPHVSAIAALVLHDHPDVEQALMEKILKNAACGLPLPANGAEAYYGYWVYEWSGNDYGSGFLQADAAMRKADIFAK